MGSLAVLMLNDHWWKYAWPSPVTGIASDFAGLIFTPILVLILLERSLPLPASPRLRRISASLGCLAVGATFAATKLHEGANAAVSHALSVGGVPLQLLFEGRLEVRPTLILRDPWDLLALPALALPLFIAWARTELEAGG